MTAGYAVAPEICLRKQVPLRHFRQLCGPRARELFLVEPEPIVGAHDRELLATALRRPSSTS